VWIGQWNSATKNNAQLRWAFINNRQWIRAHQRAKENVSLTICHRQ